MASYAENVSIWRRHHADWVWFSVRQISYKAPNLSTIWDEVDSYFVVLLCARVHNSCIYRQSADSPSAIWLLNTIPQSQFYGNYHIPKISTWWGNMKIKHEEKIFFSHMWQLYDALCHTENKTVSRIWLWHYNYHIYSFHHMENLKRTLVIFMRKYIRNNCVIASFWPANQCDARFGGRCIILWIISAEVVWAKHLKIL